jgi:hypothetical protein
MGGGGTHIPLRQPLSFTVFAKRPGTGGDRGPSPAESAVGAAQLTTPSADDAMGGVRARAQVRDGNAARGRC